MTTNTYTKWTGQLLKDWRLRNGLTQQEVANELGKTRYQTVLDWEAQNRIFPQMDCMALDVLSKKFTK